MININDKDNIFGMFLNMKEIEKYHKYYIIGNRGNYYKPHKEKEVKDGRTNKI